MIEAGEYEGKAWSVGWLTSEYQGNRKTHLEIEFKTRENVALTWRGYFSSAEAAAMTMRQLRVAGFTGDDVTTIRRPEDLPKPVPLRVKHEEYKGKQQVRVSIITPNEAKPATDNDLRALAAQLRGGASKGTGAFGDAPVWSATGDEDGMPF